MALPKYDYIQLPLLLELERAGGRARATKGSPLFDAVARHFPNLTREDRQLTRKSGENTWENMVRYARWALKDEEYVTDSERGVWETTVQGREYLRHYFASNGFTIDKSESFTKSTLTLGEFLGSFWRPEPLSARGGKAVHSSVSVPVEPARLLSEAPDKEEETSDISTRLLERLHDLTPVQFEHLIAEVLRGFGFDKVVVTQRSYDGGIDGICEIPLVELKLAFQAKRYGPSNTIRPDSIRALRGVVAGKYAAGVFATTSGFTPGAREAAEEPGVKISLIDGEDLARLLIEKNLGIKNVVVQAEIDEDFFDRLET